MDCEIVEKLEDLSDLDYSRLNSKFVVIDVIKFSTTVVQLLKNDVKYIKPFKDSDKAHEFKDKRENVVLVGEEDGVRVDGFDYNNSPTEIENSNLKNMKVGIRTTNGTRAIKEIGMDNNIYIGGTINAKFLASELRKYDEKIYLVASGRHGKESIEDTVGAKLIKDYCENKPINQKKIEEYKDQIKESKSAKKVRSIGSHKDIKKVLNFNSAEIVPKIENGIIKV